METVGESQNVIRDVGAETTCRFRTGGLEDPVREPPRSALPGPCRGGGPVVRDVPSEFSLCPNTADSLGRTTTFEQLRHLRALEAAGEATHWLGPGSERRCSLEHPSLHARPGHGQKRRRLAAVQAQHQMGKGSRHGCRQCSVVQCFDRRSHQRPSPDAGGEEEGERRLNRSKRSEPRRNGRALNVLAIGAVMDLYCQKHRP
jgi:hypothetical protein